MISYNQYVIGVTGAGSLDFFSPGTGAFKQVDLPDYVSAEFITCNHKGELFILDDSCNVYSLDSEENIILKHSFSLKGANKLVFDNNDNLYIFYQSGLYDVSESKKHFAPHLKESYRMGGGRWKVSAASVDMRNNIWIGLSYGEFGGELLAFSCSEKRFADLPEHFKDYSREAIFNIAGNMVFSHRLCHLYSCHNDICLLNADTLRKIYNNSKGEDILPFKNLPPGTGKGPPEREMIYQIAPYKNSDTVIFIAKSGVYMIPHIDQLHSRLNWKPIIQLDHEAENDEQYFICKEWLIHSIPDKNVRFKPIHFD